MRSKLRALLPWCYGLFALSAWAVAYYNITHLSPWTWADTVWTVVTSMVVAYLWMTERERRRLDAQFDAMMARFEKYKDIQ
jgi:Flp pilus assembly protein TadB